MKLTLNYSDDVQEFLVVPENTLLLNHVDVYLNPLKQIEYIRELFADLKPNINNISVYSYSPFFYSEILKTYRKYFTKEDIEVFINEKYFGSDVNKIFEIFAKAIHETLQN